LKKADWPDDMELIMYFGGLRTLRNEGFYLLDLCFTSGLKTWRIVENELRVALKGE